jgi:hypothetical protein
MTVKIAGAQVSRRHALWMIRGSVGVCVGVGPGTGAGTRAVRTPA